MKTKLLQSWIYVGIYSWYRCVLVKIHFNQWKPASFRLFILLIFSFSTSIVSSQIRKFIPGIKIDSILLDQEKPYPFLLSDNNLYQYDLKEYYKTSKEFQQSQSPKFYDMDSVIHSVAAYQSGFLLGMGDGLYFFDNGKVKKWNFPVSTQKGKITLISTCNNNFYFYQNQTIHFWDAEDYSLSSVAYLPNLSVVSVDCDKWEIVWASDGEILYQIGRSNNRLPYLEINKIDKNKNEESYVVNAYHPLIENLVIEYKTSDDNTWIETLNKQTIKLKTPSEYNYPFQVRASVDKKYYTYSPTILIESRPSNKKIWLLLSFPLMILGLASYFFYKEKRYKIQLAKAKEKYKLAEELRNVEDQTRRLQMNPHFIFNSLNSINALISLNENKKARIYLQKFSNLMRSVLNFSESKRIELDKEIVYLTTYLDLEKFSRNGSFDYEIINELEDETYIPPMLIQPFLENAIIHGFKGITYQGFIHVLFKEEPSFILVEIKDNGRGIIKANQDQKSDYQSMALKITENRLKNLSKFRPGKVIIKDRTINETSETGTMVIIKIPL